MHSLVNTVSSVNFGSIFATNLFRTIDPLLAEGFHNVELMKASIQISSSIEQLRVEGTHKCETNEGTYLDQLNNSNIQKTSCTIKKEEKHEKEEQIFIYIYVQYIHTYQRKRHSCTKQFLYGGRYASYLYYFPASEASQVQCLLFWSFYPLSL